MVAQPKPSKGSTPKGGKRTKTENVFNPAEELEIITQTLQRYQASGGTVEIVPEFYFEGQRMVAILLPGTQFADGAIVPLVAADK